MRFAFTVIAALIALASAAAPVPKAAKKNPDYFPLRLGDKWEYRDSRESSAVPYEVTRVTEQPDGTSTVEVSFGNSPPLIVITYRLTPDGAEETHLGNDELDRPVRVVSAGLKPGEEWETAVRVNQIDAALLWRVGEPESVTVPAGTFRAVPVTCSGTEKVGAEGFTKWYADGVGMVKMETRDGATAVVQELVRFTPGAKR